MRKIERNTRSDFYNKVADLLKEARKSLFKQSIKQWFIPILR